MFVSHPQEWCSSPGEPRPQSRLPTKSKCRPIRRSSSVPSLLTWRQDATFGAGWHVPGGIISYKEAAGERIRATARRELGTEVAFDPEPVAGEQFMDPDRRGGG